MKKFEFISLEMAANMSEDEIQLELGKRTKYLREELGMGRVEAADFVSSLLNMGVIVYDIFKSKKANEDNK